MQCAPLNTHGRSQPITRKLSFYVTIDLQQDLNFMSKEK